MKRYIKSGSHYYKYDTDTEEISKIYNDYENRILQETDCKKIRKIVDDAISDKRLPLWYQESIYHLGVDRCDEIKCDG